MRMFQRARGAYKATNTFLNSNFGSNLVPAVVIFGAGTMLERSYREGELKSMREQNEQLTEKLETANKEIRRSSNSKEKCVEQLNDCVLQVLKFKS